MRAEIAAQILRFGIIGLTATAVHYLVLRTAITGFGLPPAPANGVAFLIALGASWLGQSRWVFRRPGTDGARMLRFAVSALGGLLGNMAIMAIVTGAIGLPWQAGFLAALIIVPAASFAVNRLWVFRARRN